jgi:pilus assembly protein CpaB
MRAKTILTLLFLISVAVAGLVFMQAMSVRTEARAEGPEALVAAAALEPRTLLRAQDVAWRRLPGDAPPGAILRPTEQQRKENPAVDDQTRAGVYGAVVRVAIKSGEPIGKDVIVKPGERDFLRVVLTPGKRAISIPVKTGGASTGLLEAGDQVDVILTQRFGEKDERMARRSVAETVVEDLRVLAIDEVGGKGSASTISRDFGRTVTLEVTPEEAQKINVATELGRLSLTLRPAGATAVAEKKPADAVSAVWAGDVSPALGSVKPPENTVVADPSIKVMRGDKAVQVKLR